LYTRISSAVVSKYKAPVKSASPSLSNAGVDDLAPKYRSSNESKLAAAFVSDVAAFVSLVAAFVSDVAAFVSLVAALAADVAAAVAEPRIEST